MLIFLKRIMISYDKLTIPQHGTTLSTGPSCTGMYGSFLCGELFITFSFHNSFFFFFTFWIDEKVEKDFSHHRSTSYCIPRLFWVGVAEFKERKERTNLICRRMSVNIPLSAQEAVFMKSSFDSNNAQIKVEGYINRASF